MITDENTLLKIVLPIAVFAVIGTGVATAAVVPKITHPINSTKYNDNSAPTLQANNQLPTSDFITQAQAISKVTTKAGSVLKSAVLRLGTNMCPKMNPTTICKTGK